MVILILVIAALAIQWWAWGRLGGRIAAGDLSRLQATGRYTVWALVPLVAVVAAFLAAVGIEEWLGLAVIPETIARATLPLAGGLFVVAAVGAASFALRCAVGRWPSRAG